MKAELYSYTTAAGDHQHRTIDEILVYKARVSSKRKDLYHNPAGLLTHCIQSGHWSVFEMAHCCFRIETSRAMGREALRHDAAFQEFSQRYAEVTQVEWPEQRMQAETNRQSSTILASDEAHQIANAAIQNSLDAYQQLIAAGVSRETARMILPEATTTTMFMHNSIRNWITFFNSRLHWTAQKEVRLIAETIRDEFIRQLPITSAALNNFKGADKYHILAQLNVMYYENEIDNIKALWK